MSSTLPPSDLRQHAPATLRNREAILEVLRRLLSSCRQVLEVASGTGEHAVYFAKHLPHLSWQPSDGISDQLKSIEAWRRHEDLKNVRPALCLDVLERPWPVETQEAIFCANMIHITPWQATEALIAESARLLRPGGLLILYGPFREGGSHTSQSNAAFDEQLRTQNPSWGVRDRFEVQALAETAGMGLKEVVSMPANNQILVFARP